ncbi:methionine biosynthesis protein MetW [Desulfothermus naphthae]
MRFDLKTIATWVKPGSRVLDLGCDTGVLLEYLIHKKNVKGTGIEKDEEKVTIGILKGVNVIQGDINEEILDYGDQTFDYVILSRTLQQVTRPAWLISQMLRVGRKGIVSFPNYSYYKNRIFFFLKGRAPISRELPYEWFDTPNIRRIGITDFKRFCRIFGFKIEREIHISTYHQEEEGKVVKFFPNLFATYGIFMLSKLKTQRQNLQFQVKATAGFSP